MGTRNGYIVDYCTQAGLPEPTFEGKWGGLAVIFTKQKGAKPWETTDGSTKKVSEKSGQKSGQKGGQKGSQKKITERQKEILEIMAINPKISRFELSEQLKINQSAIQKHIERLKEMKVLKRIGSAKGGYWEVIS